MSQPSGSRDPLRPSPHDVLAAWAARVRANREQVEQFREAVPGDFYAPIARIFRADAARDDDPVLVELRHLLLPTDTLLDIGAGGGRYALPLAQRAVREVIALDASPGMLEVLRQGIAEYDARTVRVVEGRWPAMASPDLAADVAFISHVGYDIEDIGPFIDAMEAAARRLCVAVLLEQPPPTPADHLWPLVHGVERAPLPSLPEFLVLLLTRGRLFELRLRERPPQVYEAPEQALAWLRGQLWTAPDGAKDRRLQQLLAERLQPTAGGFSLSLAATRVGIVTWQPPHA